MRIAVIQHQFRPAPFEDRDALVDAAARAAARGAQMVVLPAIPALLEGPLDEELWRRLDATAPGVTVLALAPVQGHSGTAQMREVEPVGSIVLMSGDAVIDVAALSAAAAGCPAVAVLAPQSESELQAEAFLEFALGLSTSLAALVIIVEPDGAEIGEPGHGGTAVLHLGEVLAEAMAGDDLLTVDVDTPVGPPEPRDRLPQMPLLLAQRLATHHGQKLSVDYPAVLD